MRETLRGLFTRGQSVGRIVWRGVINRSMIQKITGTPDGHRSRSHHLVKLKLRMCSASSAGKFDSSLILGSTPSHRVSTMDSSRASEDEWYKGDKLSHRNTALL